MGTSVYTWTICYTFNAFSLYIQIQMHTLGRNCAYYSFTEPVNQFGDSYHSHQNSNILSWSKICYLYCPSEMLLESRTSASSTSVLLWVAGWQAIFFFGKFKACVKTYLDFKL